MRNLSAVLWSHIRAVPDFPKPGICFYDLTPLFMNNIDLVTDALIASIPAEKLAEAESFVAVEARGFVLASLLVNEIRSICENFVEAGYHVPVILIKGLEVADKIVNKDSEKE